MPDKIGVNCGRCRTAFREPISRIREGSQSQCPNCGAFINFSNDSPDSNIARVMRDVRRIRNGFVAATPEKP